MFPIRDTIPHRHLPVVMWALIVANAAVFLFELSLTEGQLRGFFYLFGIVPARYTRPDFGDLVGLSADGYLSFLTSMFLHGGWFHVIANMWTLWIFGDNVEDRMGPFRFLAFYVFCGIIAGVVHWLTNPHSTVPTVGASGAIAGVLGAYLVLYPTARVVTVVPIFFWPVFLELPAILYLGIWFVTQLYAGTLSLAGPELAGGVAWWAHIGGFLAGLFLYRGFLSPRRRP